MALVTRLSRVRIREITRPDDPALRPAYTLLRRTFPPSERVLFPEWIDTLEERVQGLWTDTAWHLFVAERDGEVIGLCSGMYVGNVNIGVIGYLATTAATRGAGVGSRLRDRLRRAFRADALRLVHKRLEGILGEVSATNPWLARLSRDEHVLVLDVDYYQPRLHATDDASPFVLYYESMRGVRRAIPAAELRRLLYAVWRRVYRVRRPLERSAFNAMLRSIEGRRRIGARPVPKERSAG